MQTLQSIVLYNCNNSMQFWQCSIWLQFLQILLLDHCKICSYQFCWLQCLTKIWIAVESLQSKCFAVIPQCNCNSTAIICSVYSQPQCTAGFEPVPKRIIKRYTSTETIHQQKLNGFSNIYFSNFVNHVFQIKRI